MKITGIIAEYNPFHNGHAYQIKAARENGATHIICIMSGHFTQRGDAAIADKWARTRCALAEGADLVLELPVVYSLASAQGFAKGGVQSLLATGCLDALHFGSECGDIKQLENTVYAIQEMESRHLVDTKNNTVAAARTIALQEHGHQAEADILERPNNLLGVEYILQLKKRYSHVKAETICRMGAGHDSSESVGEFCSASQLRLMLTKHPETAVDFLPQSSLSILEQRKTDGKSPVTLKALDTALLSRLRMMEPEYLSRIAGVSEGLENRLYEAIRHAHSFDEICTKVKTKRYPLSRIRRILLCAAIGITAKDQSLSPQYLRVLGQNDKGQEILRIMGQTAKLPVLLRASHFENLSPEGKRMFRLENIATDLYTMAYSPMGDCGAEYTMNLYRDTKGKQE
jgi:predicted nucleotidyltransferase